MLVVVVGGRDGDGSGVVDCDCARSIWLKLRWLLC